MDKNTAKSKQQSKENSALPQSTSLSMPAQQRAINFILEYGTNLQREQYLYFFADSSASNVMAALEHYQNTDGGFGHGLEADLRSKHSSVIATTIALQILQSIDALDSTLARDALYYLINAYDGQNWQNITAVCNDAAHAPWWDYASQQHQIQSLGFVANPTAEIISYLLTYNAMGTEFPALLDRAVEYISQSDLEMHELMCFDRLYENAHLDEKYRKALLPHLLSNAYNLVKTQPRDWEEYCLTPLTVIAGPQSIYVDFFKDVLERNFKFQIKRQNDDGSWSPNWSWGGQYPATWRKVETEIKADLTLKFLLQLQKFGRLAQPG